MKDMEQRMLQKQNEAYIDADATEVVLHRADKTVNRSDNAGGRLPGVDKPLFPQKVRIVPARSRSSSLTYTRPTGEIVESKDKLLIGMPDLDVEVHDWFNWAGRSHTVTYVEADRSTETVCQLDELGITERATE
jgi:hypothetical protein